MSTSGASGTCRQQSRITAARSAAPGKANDIVEAPAAQERRFHPLGPIGGRQQDDAFDVTQVVDFTQELTENALVDVGAEPFGAQPRRDRIDRVEEQDAGRRPPRLLEDLAQRLLRFAQPLRVQLRAVDGDERDLLSPESARAMAVLPVPDGPTSRMPRGGASPTCS